MNVDELFISTIGEIPRTAAWASGKMRELPDGGGILKRLMAAVVSAEQRGLSADDWSFIPNGSVYCEGDESLVDGVFVVESGGGHWSSRQWKVKCPIRIAMDIYGVERITGIFESEDGTQRWLPMPGTATVSSRSSDEFTEFTGTAIVDFACNILKRCITHNWVNAITRGPKSAGVEWHSRAVSGIAQLIYDLADHDRSAATLVQYLSGNMSLGVDAAPSLLSEILSIIPVRNETRMESAFEKWKDDSDLDLADVITEKVGPGWQPDDSTLADAIYDAVTLLST